MTEIRANFMNQELFVPKKVAKASSAAEGLCRWVIALDAYDKVAKVCCNKIFIISILNRKMKFILLIHKGSSPQKGKTFRS